MRGGKYRLIGRRADRPQSLVFRDQQGRHFLRTNCGARLVRLTARDAQRLLRQYPYTSVLDGAWRDYQEALGYECPLPIPDAPGILPADGN
ncbi:MAG TPA: hypothetical protein VFU72_06445 [Nitrolancea sp.]|nr:hypothetical protein [Nitrolancea sp.]